MRVTVSIVFVWFQTWLLVGCDQSPQTTQQIHQSESAEVGIRPSGLGFDPSYIDDQVAPEDDFFQYANGNWIRETTIPKDQKTVSMFTDLSELVDARQLAILDELQTKDLANSDHTDQLLLNFYLSYLNNENIDSYTTSYLRNHFDAIDRIETSAELLTLFVHLQRDGIDTPFKLRIEPDARNPSYYLLEVRQSGLGMPDRKFYIGSDDESQYLQQAYRKMLASSFALAGLDDTAENVEKVWSLETKLALAHWAFEESQDRDKSYNLYSAERVLELGQEVDWGQLFDLISDSGQRYIRVHQPSYLSQLGELTKTASLEDWKLYLKWKVLVSNMRHMSNSYQSLSNDFFGSLLGLRNALLTPNRQAVRLINRYIGDAMVAEYIKQYFSREDKQRVYQIAEQIVATAISDLENSKGWMQPATAKRAQQKLAHLGIKIGYPNVLSSYHDLELSATNRLENIVTLNAYRFDQQLAKLKRPVSSDEWYASASSIYAFYNSASNEIVFPAAILVPPFFQAEADDAANYGAIGTMIAHEVARAIDIQGSLLDGDGLQDSWWLDADRDSYLTLRSKLVGQYAQYQLLPDTTLGELANPDAAMSDLLGLELAYRAYKSLHYPVDEVIIDDFDSDQRFFLAYAQARRFKVRPDYLLRALPYIVMAPPDVRVNISLANSDAFRRAFRIRKDDKMWVSPRLRANIW